MDIEDFRSKWKYLILECPNGDYIYLKDIISSCLGGHKDGLLFIGKGEYDGDRPVFKSDDEDNLFRRKSSLDEKDVYWELMGKLYNPTIPPTY